jgi:hypothetical protein
MDNLEKLKEVIRSEIQKHLQEMSTTGNVAGYLTPKAFLGDKQNGEARIKQMAKAIGYTITNRGKKDITSGDKLNESTVSAKLLSLKENVKVLAENYYEYRNDATHKPHQKIGMAISEVNKQLKMIEKVLRMNSRLQKEYGISNDKLWKRTTNQMLKLEGRLLELAGRLREMRG